ncbi:hypothetical protein EDB92DRAFT_1815708 [Lactarius akahatsu]|uniref:Uncharacterized protein n=1 Tax=Lactarius akahatsu TaxID=416441 RepID=A0AAD4LMS5_9AGAM|nr:hypothetical protein EDB92DRAFT_1815708 [Lactarius akahatsu]
MPSREEWVTCKKWSENCGSDVIHVDVMGPSVRIPGQGTQPPCSMSSPVWTVWFTKRILTEEQVNEERFSYNPNVNNAGLITVQVKNRVNNMTYKSTMPTAARDPFSASCSEKKIVYRFNHVCSSVERRHLSNIIVPGIISEGRGRLAEYTTTSSATGEEPPISYFTLVRTSEAAASKRGRILQWRGFAYSRLNVHQLLSVSWNSTRDDARYEPRSSGGPSTVGATSSATSIFDHTLAMAENKTKTLSFLEAECLV